VSPPSDAEENECAQTFPYATPSISFSLDGLMEVPLAQSLHRRIHTHTSTITFCPPLPQPTPHQVVIFAPQSLQMRSLFSPLVATENGIVQLLIKGPARRAA